MHSKSKPTLLSSSSAAAVTETSITPETTSKISLLAKLSQPDELDDEKKCLTSECKFRANFSKSLWDFWMENYNKNQGKALLSYIKTDEIIQMALENQSSNLIKEINPIIQNKKIEKHILEDYPSIKILSDEEKQEIINKVIPNLDLVLNVSS